jgi:hypothetical protein
MPAGAQTISGLTSEIEVLEPVSRPRPPVAGSYIAPRVATLAGTTVGLIGNGLGNSTRFMEILFSLLRERYSAAEPVLVTKANVSIPPTEADWQRVTAAADVAVTGFGGCGSCSSRTVRDAIDLERAGVPAVPVIHEALYGAARAIAGVAGLPGFPFVAVTYPHMSLANWDEAECREVAESVVDDVALLLVGLAGR